MKQINFRVLTVTGVLVLIIILIIVRFGVIPLGDIWFFLLLFALLFALLFYSYLYEDRAKAFKAIALKHHLKYTYFEKVTNAPNNFFLSSTKKNILKGEINGIKIEVFDYFESKVSTLLGDSFKRSTIVIINNDIDRKKVLKGFLFGHCSIKKIEAILNDIKNK